jgi:hypothetical protein
MIPPSTFIENGTDPNGMKLASARVLCQLLTQCLPGCAPQGEGRGPPLLDARLHTRRAGHEGLVFGFNQVTRGSWPPSVLRQRDRGTPLTAGVRRTPGRTNGRPGVKPTICRARTRRTACTPACTRGARGASEPRPRPPQSIPRPSARMDRVQLGQVVGEEGRDHQLQEHPEPSTRNVRRPCPRPSFERQGCRALPKRARRRSKRRRGSLARA